ncbi:MULTISPECIES: helix-turn-helix domain-containing protein [unclassified Bartonella]|uniref:helix-turn-helix domain-containing protein n=1 Tax=unclassified Bartonella TaxID=2645622 RepID=UPI0020C5435E|nr:MULTISPECIES: helix-turn-helix domain-containing protein [unclassified Bartonella]
MIRQKELKIWIRKELDKMGRGSQAKLAAHLGIRRPAISNMINLNTNREMRDIKADELVKIMEFFKDSSPISGPYSDDFLYLYSQANDSEKKIVEDLLKSLLAARSS